VSRPQSKQQRQRERQARYEARQPAVLRPIANSYVILLNEVYDDVSRREHPMAGEKRANQLARRMRTQLTVRKLLRESGATPPDDERERRVAALAREILLRVDVINLLHRLRKDHQSNRGPRRSVL
jgi:hypothetical protein